MLAFLLACHLEPGAVSVPVREAFDVPPPPGRIALDVGPLDAAGIEPGAGLLLDGALVEVVDVRPERGGLVLTVYAEAARAAPWVEAGRLVLREPPRRAGPTP